MRKDNIKELIENLPTKVPTRRKEKRRTSITSKATASPNDGAECVPKALTWLLDELVFYKDLNAEKKVSKNLGFSWYEVKQFLEETFPAFTCFRLKGFQQDPKRCLERISNEPKNLPSQKLLVFGLLKDGRKPGKKKRQPVDIHEFWHCGAINLENSSDKQFYCALSGNVDLEIGISTFRSIQALLAIKKINNE
jgi:hypothetical protein